MIEERIEHDRDAIVQAGGIERFWRTAASWNITFLASAYIMKIACSATLTEFAVPTTISGMPRAVSAGISTAS